MVLTRIGPLLQLVLNFYAGLIVIYVLLSWIPANEGIVAELHAVLATICEPYVGLFRRVLPMAMIGGAGLDFSPLIALVVLQLIGRLIVF